MLKWHSGWDFLLSCLSFFFLLCILLLTGQLSVGPASPATAPCSILCVSVADKVQQSQSLLISRCDSWAALTTGDSERTEGAKGKRQRNVSDKNSLPCLIERFSRVKKIYNRWDFREQLRRKTSGGPGPGAVVTLWTRPPGYEPNTRPITNPTKTLNHCQLQGWCSSTDPMLWCFCSLGGKRPSKIL